MNATATVTHIAAPPDNTIRTVIAADRRLAKLYQKVGRDGHDPESDREIAYLNELLNNRLCPGMSRDQIQALIGKAIEPQARARASSIFDAGTIDRRLIHLAGKPQTAEVEAEIDYLTKLRARKFPNAAVVPVE